MNRSKWLLLTTLLIAVFVLSGCGVPQEGVDVLHTAPDGLWQTLAIWPLAKALIWLSDLLASVPIPYHWGWAIIIFTLFIKAITFPLTLTQIRGMQAQKDLAPKIQELQKKYGKDREKLAAEQMKLYQEAGVNPLSGCLPLVIQMPVLFALYAAMVALGPNFNNANFFWIPDLGFPKYGAGTSWLTEAFSSGDYGTLAAYLVLPVLLVVSQFVMQKWMTTTTPSSGDGQAKMMQQVSLMMTFMFGFFTITVPSGLTLYWVTSNLLQLLQQWVITDGRFNLTGSSPAVVVAGDSAKVAKIATNGADAADAPTVASKSRTAQPTGGKRRRTTKSKGK